MSIAAARTEKLDLRLSRVAKDKLRQAAAISGRSLSEFVLESAIARAEDTLPDRSQFLLNDSDWAAFSAALDAPVKSMPGMAALLRAQPSIGKNG
jgi:uncharacterized protein (DUF1778 family)